MDKFLSYYIIGYAEYPQYVYTVGVSCTMASQSGYRVYRPSDLDVPERFSFSSKEVYVTYPSPTFR